MIEFYPEIRFVHVTAVYASGGLFFLRGLMMIGGMQRARAMPVRILSYTIDTTLLTAALMLMTILHQYPFVHAWLTAKVLLLILYVALAFLALGTGRPQSSRVGLWLSGLAVYGFIISIAVTRHPLGVFSAV